MVASTFDERERKREREERKREKRERKREKKKEKEREKVRVLSEIISNYETGVKHQPSRLYLEDWTTTDSL